MLATSAIWHIEHLWHSAPMIATICGILRHCQYSRAVLFRAAYLCTESGGMGEEGKTGGTIDGFGVRHYANKRYKTAEKQTSISFRGSQSDL